MVIFFRAFSDPLYLSVHSATPTSLDVVVGVAVAVTFLVLLNAVLLFCIVKRRKSSSDSLSSGKNTAASNSEGNF